MTAPPSRTPRRTEALSRDRIVAAAVELLDAAGERGLTFRALTEHLVTGPGAIYWHVANKGELLGAATDAVVAAAVESGGAASPDQATPQDRIREIALGLFDAVDEHPWAAPQLSDGAWQAANPRMLESVGRQVSALGVPAESRFSAASVLVQYIVGAAVQNAANAATGRSSGSAGQREEFLDAASRDWAQLDPEAYPFTRTVAAQLREHDDRAEFLAGLTVVLAGITAVYPAGVSPARAARRGGRPG